MRNLTAIILASLCLFYSCKQSSSSNTTAKRIDTVYLPAKTTAKAPDTLKADSLKPVAAKSPSMDIDALYAKSKLSCPVTVRKCSIASLGHGSKAVIVTLYNNTTRKISALKIWWIVYNKTGKQIGNSSGMAKKEVAGAKPPAIHGVSTHLTV